MNHIITYNSSSRSAKKDTTRSLARDLPFTHSLREKAGRIHLPSQPVGSKWNPSVLNLDRTESVIKILLLLHGWPCEKNRISTNPTNTKTETQTRTMPRDGLSGSEIKTCNSGSSGWELRHQSAIGWHQSLTAPILQRLPSIRQRLEITASITTHATGTGATGCSSTRPASACVSADGSFSRGRQWGNVAILHTSQLTYASTGNIRTKPEE